MKIKQLVILHFWIILISCTSTKEHINIEYFKRDNLAYSDPFLYELIVRIENDSFILAEYKTPFNAIVSRGTVRKDKNKKTLSVNKTKTISLNKSRTITTKDDNNSIYYELSQINSSEFRLEKWLNGRIDTIFRNKPFKLTSEISSLEKWFFDENPNFETYTLSTINDKNKPNKSEMLQEEIELREEINALSNERHLKLNKLVRRLKDNCKVVGSDSIIMNIIVSQNGGIESYKFVKYSATARNKIDCISNELTNDSINLGEIKILPNARSGSTIISYNLPVNIPNRTQAGNNG